MYLVNSIEHDRIYSVKSMKKREKLEKLIKEIFSSLQKHAKVFEIGSGDGTNAKFIENLGFEVTASDTADAFINSVRCRGLKTIKFDALEDNFPEKYSAIFCWRVFVHFTKDDALKIIQKAYNNLEGNGIFMFNAINRETKNIDNEWIDFEGEYHLGAKCYYNYFSKKDLDNIIQHTKFQIADFRK